MISAIKNLYFFLVELDVKFKLLTHLNMKTTRYFEEQVLRKRPYIRREWCERVVANPLKTEVQSDGRIRFWGKVPEFGRVLRVVTLADGETIHNAFPDRNFVMSDESLEEEP